LFPSSAGTWTAAKSSPASRPRRPLLFLWDTRPYCQRPPAARMTAPQPPKKTLVFILPRLAALDRLVGGSTESGPAGFGTLLSRSIHSTEKAAEVCCQCDDNYGCSLDRRAVSGHDSFVVPSGSHVDESHHPDQDA